MYGNDMLVAPVYMILMKEVYLQSSKWTSVHDGSVEGGQTIQVQAYALDL